MVAVEPGGTQTEAHSAIVLCYILKCVMDLPDKPMGNSAASGEKEIKQGSLPAAAVGAF